MQYITAAALALAIGASAAPQWHFPSGGFGGGAGPGNSVSFPAATGTGIAPFPTATGSTGIFFRATNTTADDGDGDDENEDEDEGDDSESSDDDESSSDDSDSSESSSSSAASSGATTTASASVSDSSAASGGSLPASSGTSVLDAVQTIAAGESFDGGMVMFDRGTSCTGQSEGGDSDAVFELEDGASISNVIIGPNQIEGIHCFGACTLTNVWWSAVCEDAFSIKEQDAGETTTITGGGAFGAEDKVFQHNGAGTLSVSGFTVETFGKLYRSCGNCDSMYERHVIMDDISATDGSILAGINSNYGDTATLTNIVTSGVETVCTEFEGNDTGDEPEEISSGPSDYCIYSTSDITAS